MHRCSQSIISLFYFSFYPRTLLNMFSFFHSRLEMDQLPKYKGRGFPFKLFFKLNIYIYIYIYRSGVPATPSVIYSRYSTASSSLLLL